MHGDPEPVLLVRWIGARYTIGVYCGVDPVGGAVEWLIITFSTGT